MEKVYFEPMENGSILKLSQDDEEKELEFELNYLASLTFEERLKMMKQKSREMLRQMVEHGHRRPFEILKRTSQNPPNSQTEEIGSCDTEMERLRRWGNRVMGRRGDLNKHLFKK